jgi:hypothetical protein
MVHTMICTPAVVTDAALVDTAVDVGGTEERVGRAAGAELGSKPWFLHEVNILAAHIIPGKRVVLVTVLWQSQAHILLAGLPSIGQIMRIIRKRYRCQISCRDILI